MLRSLVPFLISVCQLSISAPGISFVSYYDVTAARWVDPALGFSVSLYLLPLPHLMKTAPTDWLGMLSFALYEDCRALSHSLDLELFLRNLIFKLLYLPSSLIVVTFRVQ